MKSLKKLLLSWTTVFLTLFSCLAPASAGELLDKVAAVVNDDVITQSEVDQLLGPIYEQYKTMFTGDQLYEKMEEARQSLLNQLIEDKLVYHEAVRLGVDVEEAEINERMREIKDRLQDKNFDAALQDQGLSFTKLRDRFKEQIAIRKLHQYEIGSKTVVTPKEIEKFYKSHVAEFQQQERLKLSTITIRRKKDDAAVTAEETAAANKATRESAEEVLRQLYAGGDFAGLAKQYSEDTKAEKGGDLGYIYRGDLIQVLDEAVFKLAEGEISPILETELGYHIFKLEEKVESTVKPLDEVRDEINERLYREKSTKRFKEWISNLKKEAYISIR